MENLKRNAAIAIAMLAAVPGYGRPADEVEGPIVGLCCPGVDHGVELQSFGLGQSFPSGPDLSLDPSWRVHAFRRDGMEYFQVNDLAGRVQLIIGRAGDHYWTLPAGEESGYVVLPPEALQVPLQAGRSTVYRTPAFSLVRYRAAGRAVWSVETTSLSR